MRVYVHAFDFKFLADVFENSFGLELSADVQIYGTGGTYEAAGTGCRCCICMDCPCERANRATYNDLPGAALRSRCGELEFWSIDCAGSHAENNRPKHQRFCAAAECQR